MNCHSPSAPAGERTAGSKPLSTIASQIRSSGIPLDRNVFRTASRYFPTRRHHTVSMPRPRESYLKNSRKRTRRGSQRTGNSGMSSFAIHDKSLVPSAAGGSLGTGVGGKPEPCTSGRSSVEDNGDGNSLGHPPPNDGDADGKSSRSAFASAVSSALSAPIVTSSAVGPPAI